MRLCGSNDNDDVCSAPTFTGRRASWLCPASLLPSDLQDWVPRQPYVNAPVPSLRLTESFCPTVKAMAPCYDLSTTDAKGRSRVAKRCAKNDSNPEGGESLNAVASAATVLYGKPIWHSASLRPRWEWRLAVGDAVSLVTCTSSAQVLC